MTTILLSLALMTLGALAVRLLSDLHTRWLADRRDARCWRGFRDICGSDAKCADWIARIHEAREADEIARQELKAMARRAVEEYRNETPATRARLRDDYDHMCKRTADEANAEARKHPAKVLLFVPRMTHRNALDAQGKPRELSFTNDGENGGGA